MTATQIPADRQLPEFHSEVKEITAQVSNQSDTLRNNRKALLQKIKEIQEIRALTSIRSGYFLRMTPNNVQDFSQLPFMKPDGISISERLVEMSGIGTIRADINRFLKEIYVNRNKLPEILANLPPNCFPDSLPFLPAGVRPKDFFACSTIPAIFGHHWTVELRLSFINFLMEIVEKLPPTVFSTNFRDHWLFDCFKNYIHASGIHKFLSLSIGEAILNLVRDEEIINLSKRPNQDFFNKITDYAAQMITSMNEHCSVFPPDVRLLFKRFVEMAPTPEEKLNRIEILFMDCILAPAVSLPTTYGVVPATFYFDMGINGPARTLQVLAQCFRFILHPKATIRYQGIDFSRLFSLPFSELLDKFTHVEESAIIGPKINSILPLLGLHYIIMLFSISDIFLLGYILQQSASTASPNLINYAKKMPSDQPANFSFFRYEAWDFNVFGITKPDIPENEVERPQNTTASKAAEAIYRMLSYIPTNKLAPKGTMDFIKFYEKQNKITRNFVSESYIRHLDVIFSEVPKDQQSIILPSLEDEIRRHMAYITRNHETLVNIEYQMKILKNESQNYQEKMSESMPILYAHFLNLFLQKNPGIINEIKTKKAEFFIQDKLFYDYFQAKMHQLNLFIAPIANFALPGVTCHFHTYLMQQITFQEFQASHQELALQDRKFSNASNNVLRIQNIPEKVSELFTKPSLFAFAINCFKRAEFLKLPIESIKEVSRTFELLNQMFSLEVEGTPQPEEFAAMLNYVFLSSNLSDLFSLYKYLEIFLIMIPQHEYKFTSDSERLIMTQFTNQIYSLMQTVQQF